MVCWARLGGKEKGVQRDQGKAQVELGCSPRRRWKVGVLEGAGSSWVCWTVARRDLYLWVSCVQLHWTSFFSLSWKLTLQAQTADLGGSYFIAPKIVVSALFSFMVAQLVRGVVCCGCCSPRQGLEQETLKMPQTWKASTKFIPILLFRTLCQCNPLPFGLGSAR